MLALFRFVYIIVLLFSFTEGINTVVKHDDENSAQTWTKRAQQTLSENVLRSRTPVGIKAKSAILAVGAGMSVDTLTAARFLQSREIEQDTPLYFENFPVVGMAKTYCVDTQIGEGACTATAYLSGVKSKSGITGSAQVGGLGRCGTEEELDKMKFGSITEWALAAGKSVGIVTTSSVTHPGVAGSYARTTKVSWENDNDVLKDGHDPVECPDLATQLLQGNPGNKFKVILGGGRQHFLSNSTLGGKRADNNNLITEWINERINLKQKHAYVGNKKDLSNIDSSVEHLLGLFTLDYMPYHTLAAADQPTIEDMTEAAIKVLSKNKKGFFLYIFGGRIADAHSENKAILALHETLEFSKAIKKASSMTKKDDTLMVVTANHAHTMKLAGYGTRWQSYFEGIDNVNDKVDDFRYLSINYANGPGYRNYMDKKIPNIDEEIECKQKNPSFKFLAHYPLEYGTSGGDDVAIFAQGPSQFLFNGVMEQHMLPHLMAYSMCIGFGITACNNDTKHPLPVVEDKTSSAIVLSGPIWIFLMPLIIINLSLKLRES